MISFKCDKFCSLISFVGDSDTFCFNNFCSLVSFVIISFLADNICFDMFSDDTFCICSINWPGTFTVVYNISIYKFGLSVCLSVCLYPINVKTAEPIGPKFFVGPHVTPGKVYE